MKAKLDVYKSNFTKYCEIYGEWEMLVDRRIYIKLSSAFFFVDVDILRVQMIVKNELHRCIGE
jgi:hypothetical protein